MAKETPRQQIFEYRAPKWRKCPFENWFCARCDKTINKGERVLLFNYAPRGSLICEKCGVHVHEELGYLLDGEKNLQEML